MNKHIENFITGPTGILALDPVFAYIMLGFLTLFLVKLVDAFSDGQKNDTVDDIMCFILWPVLVVIFILATLRFIWIGPRKLWRHK